MRLIELRANHDSFHTVKFNQTGISIIASIQLTKDKKKTYNSVGKSLTISLIHFCLGAKTTPDLKEKLSNWIFYLDFKIYSETFTAERSVENSDTILLNNKEYSLKAYTKLLETKLFAIQSDKPKYISFRGLIPRFIRYGSDGYISYDRFIREEEKQHVTRLINNAFLLGLDINLILKKAEIKQKDKNIEQLKKQLKNPEFQALFGISKPKDLQIKAVELETSISKLKHNIDNFQIAEDYYEVKKEADNISQQLRERQNQIAQLKIIIANIEKSLNIQPDITKEQVLKLYTEAQVHLNDVIIKRLDELEEFNNKILVNRKKKLTQEKNMFAIKLQSIESEVIKLSSEENKKLQYLHSKGALDDYLKLSQLLADQEKELHSLNQYRKLTSDYIIASDTNKSELMAENITTETYLQESDDLISKNIAIFKSFVEKFYSEKSSGITVSNNEGNNTLRFDIKAKIQDDAGNAVNEVKIFCYDWTILKAQHNHFVKLLFHDSKITGDMDTRQILTMLEIANSECRINDFQYIISLNQNVIDALKNEINDEKTFEDLVSKNIILTLSDKSPEDKLLGIQIDLDYDK